MESTFRLFKNDSSKTEIKLTNDANDPITGLDYGDYVITYKTMFHQLNSVGFTINSTALKEITLCYDFLDYEANKNILALDELRPGKSFTLQFYTQGCFHFKNDALEITKTDENMYLNYKDTALILTHPQIKLLREFEIELRSNHGSGCTTKDEYTIYTDHSFDTYATIDESCQWNGFYNLLHALQLSNTLN